MMITKKLLLIRPRVCFVFKKERLCQREWVISKSKILIYGVDGCGVGNEYLANHNIIFILIFLFNGYMWNNLKNLLFLCDFW